MKPTKNILSTRILTNKPANSDGLYWEDVAFISTEVIAFDQKDCLDWINANSIPAIAIFTSANSLESLTTQGFPLDNIVKVCCISGATKKAVHNHLPQAEIIAEGKNARLLLQEMAGLFSENRFLFFSGKSRLNTIPNHLQQAGADFMEVMVYETKEHSHKIKKELDAVLFFSPSSVTSYLKYNRLRAHTIAVSIGESTTKALKPFSANIVEASFPSEEAMIDATIKALK